MRRDSRAARGRNWNASHADDWSVADVDVLFVGFVLGHGGDAVQMIDLASEVARRGPRVRILIPDLPTAQVAEERGKSLGLDIQRTPYIRVDAKSSRQNLMHLLQLFRDNTARLYHFHTGDVCLPRLVTLALGLLEIGPTIVTTHSPYANLKPGDARARYWAHVVDRHVDRVICPSDHSRRLQIGYGLREDKVQTIRNSVDTRRFSAGSPQAVFDALGLPQEKQLIVFSSRLDPQKRPLDAIKAFQLIVNDYPEAHLVMAGSGIDEEGLRAYVEHARIGDRVHFPGFQSNVPDWLAAATAWVFPTESENFSLALLEALAAGCPIVATDCSGNDEILKNDVNALVVRVGDVEGIARRLALILGDAALRARLIEGARATASEYQICAMVDRYARSYNECLGVAGAN